MFKEWQIRKEQHGLRRGVQEMQKWMNCRELPAKKRYKFQHTICASKRSVSGPEKEIPGRPGLLVWIGSGQKWHHWYKQWHCEVNVSSIQMNAWGTWVTLFDELQHARLLLTHLSQQLLQRPGCTCLALPWYGCIEGPKWPEGRANALIPERKSSTRGLKGLVQKGLWRLWKDIQIRIDSNLI